MYGQEPQSSPFAYASNPASSFLYDQMQNNTGGSAYGTPGSGGGLVGQQFGQVMNSMSGGLQQGMQQGIVPGGDNGNLTPQQVAAQMNISGPMSVLPILGGSFLPKVMYPIAGAWSLVDGIKSMRSMSKEARVTAANSARFDPRRDLQYERSMQEMHQVSERWSQLGPLNNSY